VDFIGNADAFFLQAYDNLLTATLTADYRPIDNLTIRLEHRFEFADEDVFVEGNADAGGVMGTQGIWNATTLSMVVHTN